MCIIYYVHIYSYRHRTQLSQKQGHVGNTVEKTVKNCGLLAASKPGADV